jgi:hypothetical protein
MFLVRRTAPRLFDIGDFEVIRWVRIESIQDEGAMNKTIVVIAVSLLVVLAVKSELESPNAGSLLRQ